MVLYLTYTAIGQVEKCVKEGVGFQVAGCGLQLSVSRNSMQRRGAPAFAGLSVASRGPRLRGDDSTSILSFEFWGLEVISYRVPATCNLNP